jgi:hypothetical protein
VSACGAVQIQFRISPPSPESVVSLPYTMFVYYGYNARPVRSVDLISVALMPYRPAIRIVNGAGGSTYIKKLANVSLLLVI